jgi:hypothetical protein
LTVEPGTAVAAAAARVSLTVEPGTAVAAAAARVSLTVEPGTAVAAAPARVSFIVERWADVAPAAAPVAGHASSPGPRVSSATHAAIGRALVMSRSGHWMFPATTAP